MEEPDAHWESAETLRTEADQAAYFNTCLDNDPGDGRLVRLALEDIVRARAMSSASQKVGLPDDVLCESLVAENGLKFSAFMRTISALGFRLRATQRVHLAGDDSP
ncbi:DNA-binding protein [Luteibacter sp. CQ10]|uniref:DNA-binding protein n=1 Tax=Luteibacter sp. CQ10 TaxID=2805821 RepID=UPI0034A4DF24